MTAATSYLRPSPSKRRHQKYRSVNDIINNTSVDDDDYNDVVCDECGSGDDEVLLLCDKCDKGYHLTCHRPVVVRVPIGPWFCRSCSDHRPPSIKSFSQSKIFDFFKIKKCTASSLKRISPQDSRRRRKRIVHHKKRRKLLPYAPSEETAQRLKQMRSLASALTSLNMKYSDHLTYSFDMAPRSANLSVFEKGGMQVLSKEDTETLEYCRAMLKRGECPPLLVIFDSCEGYTVEADGPIKDLTLITEYVGDVDYIKNREHDDCDSMMTLLLASNPSKSLVICPDKRGNIARFINGINNFTPEAKKKQNLKCVRYSVNGECRVLLVATRDIAKGERLYYDYNGYEHEYPTHHFV